MELIALLSVAAPVPVSELSEEQLRELQIALSLLGYPVGDIDGLIGPKTRNAWAEFKIDCFPGNPTLIGRESVETLRSQVNALSTDKRSGDDFSSREGVIAAIKKECTLQGLGQKPQIAYVLATTQWETNQTFQPVREAYWLSEQWRQDNLRYFPYYGRGYVQLTWKNNYQKYSQILGVDLETQPDLAMTPGIALFVLVHGFKTGAFTGRKLGDYVDAGRVDFIQARRCINGTDRAHEIAAIAEDFLTVL